MENTDDVGIRCNEHPDAPHGFMRDASHSAGRYVCECESWEPPKEKQKPVGYVTGFYGGYCVIQPTDPAVVLPVGTALYRAPTEEHMSDKEKLAQWMIEKGYATGHGDTIEDLLQELEWQIAENLNRAITTEREACAYRANIALLGANRGLANRINHAIRNGT